jgi:hypothetical protein
MVDSNGENFREPSSIFGPSWPRELSVFFAVSQWLVSIKAHLKMANDSAIRITIDQEAENK